jgi:hypothetical protein
MRAWLRSTTANGTACGATAAAGLSDNQQHGSLGAVARGGRPLRLPTIRVLVGAALAGLPSVLAVVLGLHWLGAAVAVVLFALWCARLAREPGLPARAV